jgi:hypothetical protein
MRASIISVSGDGDLAAISWAAVSCRRRAERESLNDERRLDQPLAGARDWQLVEDGAVRAGQGEGVHLGDRGVTYARLGEVGEAR